MYCEVLDGKTWISMDGMATENETIQFLAALVRLTKPNLAIETGTYQGQSALAMVAIMTLEGFGHLHTCDTEDPKIEWPERVTFHHATSAEMIEGLSDGSVDFAFLDGGDRLQEFQSLIPKLAARPYIVIHDTRRLSVADKEAFAALENRYSLERVTIDTPRGAWLLHSL